MAEKETKNVSGWLVKWFRDSEGVISFVDYRVLAADVQT